MKKLNELLNDIITLKEINVNMELSIPSIVFDSRKIKENSLFVATKGTQVDGHEFIEKSIDSGAKVIVCEDLPKILQDHITYIQVKNSQKTLGLLASNFYDNPSHKLNIVGITGTNGKTSTATMLYHLMSDLGYKVGLLSTIQVVIGDEKTNATHTTPDAVSIQFNMNKMVEAGCTYCFMEVSSHAIEQERIAGIKFKGGVFTNITHDHLDYHKTFQNYIQAKKKFFDELNDTAFVLTNIDDKNGKLMLQNTKAMVKTMAMHAMADYRVKILDATLDYMTVQMNDKESTLQLAGEFNAYNALTCYAVACELGMKSEEVLIKLSNLKPVEGRIEIIQIPNSHVKGIVDYAHTPDAVEKVLVELNKIQKNGNIITVIGCGGDRDKEKRPLMAQFAAQYSQRLILTSDNPRSEDPKSIIEDMKLGLVDEKLKKTLVVTDREEAIKTACLLAEGGDIIAVLGKGHEKYQEVKGERFHFDDKEVLGYCLELTINEN